MNKIIMKNLSRIDESRPLACGIFSGLNFFMVIAYACLLTMLVNTAMETKQNLKLLNSLSQEYQESEKRFLTIMNEIDIDYARQLGFTDKGVNVKYALRAGGAMAKK